MSTTVAAPAAPADKQRARAFAGALLGLAVGIGAVGVLGMHWRVSDRAELATVDLRFSLFPAADHASNDLVVLAIDDNTRRMLTAWPVDRAKWGKLVQVLRDLGARAVVFDVGFQDRLESADALETDDPWSGPENGANHTFGAYMHAVANVVVPVFAQDVEKGASTADLQLTTGLHPRLRSFLEHRLVPVHGKPTKLPPLHEGLETRLILPEANILVGARAVGSVNDEWLLDPGVTLRRFLPAVQVEDDVPPVPTLAVAAYAVSLAGPAASASWDRGDPPADEWPALPAARVGDESFHIGPRSIPLRGDGTAWVRWRGKWDEAPLNRHVRSAWWLLNDHRKGDMDVLDRLLVDGTAAIADQEKLTADGWLPGREKNAEVDLAAFRDKIVLVGWTVQGEMQDVVGTPFGNQPGVYYHAAVLDTLLGGDFLRSVPPWTDAFAILLVSTLAGLLVLGTPQIRSVSGSPVLTLSTLLAPGLLLIPLHFAIVLVAFRAGWIANMFHAELGALLTTAFSAGMAWVFIRRDHQEEMTRRQKLDALFTRIVSPDVAKQLMSQDPAHLLGGKKMPLTVYFSDIAGFTTISEALPPERLVEILNEYLTRVTELLQNRFRGTVDKYIGDAVMAFWGAPTPAPDGATTACIAALEALAVMEQFSTELIARGLSPLRTRIGINTGPAVVGGVGHPRRVSYTALGDTVNLASRLEGANKAYGTSCMLGPATWEQAKDRIVARELDLVKVKGKHIPVRVYELMGRSEDAIPEKREIKRRYESALAKYRARDFAGARDEFSRLVAETNDPPSKTFVERCDERLRSPPGPDWDGSNELHEK